MSRAPVDGTALVLCEGAFGSSDGKTAHGLVRHTDRYRVLAIIDSRCAGRDAGLILDQRPAGIPVVASLREAIETAGRPDFLVVGVATHGGTLPDGLRPIVRQALEIGIHVDSGLHELLGDDPEFAAAAARGGARIRDVRRTPPRDRMHAFSGAILKVGSIRVAILGTDSGVGKRTTAVRLVQGLEASGIRSVLVGTGQTAWMQGVRYGLVMDALINDFVSGEIEHQVVRAFREERPDVIVIEGQGCLTHPAYPGGFEILAGARPDAVFLQHAPARPHYDGFPEFPLAGVDREAEVIRLLSGRPVAAITLNHEGLDPDRVRAIAAATRERLGIPCCDPLLDGVEPLVRELRRLFPALPR